MTLPDPGRISFLEILYQGQRLGIVNDDCIAILYVKSGRIFEHDLFVDGFIGIRNVDHFPLQCVVQLLGAGKKGRSSLNHAPSGCDAHGVEYQRERSEDFGDAAAVKRRADMNKMQRAKRVTLLEDSLDGCCANERLVLFQGMKTQRGGLDGGCRFGRHGCICSILNTADSSRPQHNFTQRIYLESVPGVVDATFVAFSPRAHEHGSFV
jgi:hypothetical protein